TCRCSDRSGSSWGRVRTLGLGLGSLLGQLLFVLEELVELALVEVLELLGEASAVEDPLPRRLFQDAGDVQQGTPALVSGGQVEGAVQLASLAAAGGLAAGSCALDQ